MTLWSRLIQHPHCQRLANAEAGLLEGAGGDGDVDAILSRLHALEEEKADFERLVAQSK